MDIKLFYSDSQWKIDTNGAENNIYIVNFWREKGSLDAIAVLHSIELKKPTSGNKEEGMNGWWTPGEQSIQRIGTY